MAMDKAAFRLAFPEFTDTAKYPDSMLTFWESVAGIHCSETKWSSLYTVGMSLALAHFITIAAASVVSAGAGLGLISSESAGDVSVSMDTSNIVEDKAGNWNETSYGRQFIRMARLVGGCAMQL